MKLELISRLAEPASKAPPLLFVHGAWHGAWCWDVHFLEFFASHGYDAHTLSLRGHGESEGRARLRWASMKDYVNDVATVAGGLRSPPVVIGHSMGGYVVQKYLEAHAAPAAVLLATAPASGVLRTALRLGGRHPLAFIKALATLSQYPLVSTPALAREAFFSADLSNELVQTYWSRLQDESFRGFIDMLFLNLPKPKRVTAPVLVLAGEDDAIFYPHQFEATARAYRTHAERIPGIAHDVMLEPKWRAAAERVLAWVSEAAGQS